MVMPFSFKKSESPAEGVRRECHERVSTALGRLRSPGSAAAIHGVRKEIKKLRAMLRLVRGQIGRGDFRKGAKALREAAHRLAPPRDARVALRAFEKLTEGAGRRFAGIEAALKKTPGGRRGGFNGKIPSRGRNGCC